MTLRESNARFAFSLYLSAAEDKQGNMVICPLSFSVAFALLLNGADQQTAQEIRRSTGLGDLPLDSVNEQNLNLQEALARLNDSGPQTFLLANSLWASLPLSFSSAFVQTGAHYYGTEIKSVKRAELPAQVSQWSRTKTQDKVDMRLQETDFALLSAAYFKGQWKYPFAEESTRQEDFHPEGKPARLVPMMSQEGEYSYFEGKNFQLLSLPYSTARMTFLLPARGGLLRKHTLQEIERQVLADAWVLTQPMAFRPGLIKIPRFKLQFDHNFIPVLEKLGVHRLFDSFDSLRAAVTHPEGAKVTQVLQNSMISVDEKGAEAASVLALGVRAGAAPGWKPPKPFEFIANRPFSFWVTDDLSGSILFLGRVTEP